MVKNMCWKIENTYSRYNKSYIGLVIGNPLSVIRISTKFHISASLVIVNLTNSPPKAEDTEEEDDEPGKHAGIVFQVGHHITVAVGAADLHRHIRKPHNTCYHHLKITWQQFHDRQQTLSKFQASFCRPFHIHRLLCKSELQDKSNSSNRGFLQSWGPCMPPPPQGLKKQL